MAMMFRRVKQLIHEELDVARGSWLGRSVEAPIDLSVEFEVQEAQHASMIQETETEAARLLAALNKECPLQNQKEWEECQPGSSTPCDSAVSRMSGVPAEGVDVTSVASGASAAKCVRSAADSPSGTSKASQHARRTFFSFFF